MTTENDLLTRIQSRLSSPETHFRMSDALLLKEAAKAIERYEKALKEADELVCEVVRFEGDDPESSWFDLRETIREALQHGKVKAE